MIAAATTIAAVAHFFRLAKDGHHGVRFSAPAANVLLLLFDVKM